MAAVVIAGATPLIALARVVGITRLQQRFGGLVIQTVLAQLHASDCRIAPAVIQTVLDPCGEGAAEPQPAD